MLVGDAQGEMIHLLGQWGAGSILKPSNVPI